MERYIGLDPHGTSCTFAVIGPSGRKLRHDVVETNGAALVEFLRSIPTGARAGHRRDHDRHAALRPAWRRRGRDGQSTYRCLRCGCGDLRGQPGADADDAAPAFLDADRAARRTRIPSVAGEATLAILLDREQVGLVRGDWKYIRAGEERDGAVDNPATAKELNETLEMLRALGYVGGAEAPPANGTGE